MGKDETTAVFYISEQRAEEAATADAVTCEAVRRPDARRSFLGLQVQVEHGTADWIEGLVTEAWQQQAPKRLAAEHAARSDCG